MIVDTHAHVWDPARVHYPWLRPGMGPLLGTFGYPDLAAHLDDEHELESCDRGEHVRAVLVQAADDPRDVEVMADVAADEPRVAGLVVWAPVDRPELVEGEVERAGVIAADAGTRVVGVRTMQHRHEGGAWLARPETDAGLAVLDGLGLAYECLVTTPEGLAQLPAVAERHPGLRLVVDHLGSPPLGDPDGLARWRELLAPLAEHPAVVAKLSGLFPRGVPAREYADSVREVVDVALELFGPRRLMLGSAWPVSLVHGGPALACLAVDAALQAALDGDELLEVRAGTASDVYGLATVSS
ncbi:amidohydrolase family protein [Cellulomonas palmilytica]|uniref:amidohydrolase family protein n=1 Tax=Cellulomonas palmilytica TaxID=2608402 RepID=UPI001F3F62F3|nr:amidohydrolase family protein [Cellulomonas palmilytica]UJP40755.1 amidohydrolase family protein [Cellulomonas palmilytica]